MAIARLEQLDEIRLPGCRRAFVARSPRARLLGLAWLDEMPPDSGLLLPRCRCVHTFGMRFPLDVWFLDEGGEVVSLRRHVPARRVVGDRRAAAVLERPAASAAAARSAAR